MGQVKISVAVIYRDRGEERLFKCIQSLLDSTCSFEIIVVDYGSQDFGSENFSQRFPENTNLSVLKLNAEGWLFNKSEALNYALQKSTGEYFLVADVDLIFPSHFLDTIAKKVSNGQFLNYRCIYLNKDQNYDSKLDYSKLIHSDDTGVGLICAPREVLLDIGGYNEFYKMWGFEDLEMHRRLLVKGLKHQWIEVDQLQVYHQWHPRNEDTMPNGWFDQMKVYFDSHQDITISNNRSNLNIEKRPCLNIKKSNNLESGQRLVVNGHETKIQTSVRIQQTICSLTPGSFVYGHWKHTEFSLVQGKFKKMKKLINALRGKEVETNKKLTFDELIALLFFIIIGMETEIEDYYFHFNKHEVKFILQK